MYRPNQTTLTRALRGSFLLIKLNIMNYDQWKTMSDRDERSDEVTSCCGVEQESSGASNCCDARFWSETDICGACKEHADEYMMCSECGDNETHYTMISQFEYDERKREDAAEMYRDDY